jgi:hypothetical protein
MQDATLNPIPLRYDGIMLGLHQFTEIDPSVASYGASFYLDTLDPVAVAKRREEKRIQFASAARS